MGSYLDADAADGGDAVAFTSTPMADVCISGEAVSDVGANGGRIDIYLDDRRTVSVVPANTAFVASQSRDMFLIFI